MTTKRNIVKNVNPLLYLVLNAIGISTGNNAGESNAKHGVTVGFVIKIALYIVVSCIHFLDQKFGKYMICIYSISFFLTITHTLTTLFEMVRFRGSINTYLNCVGEFFKKQCMYSRINYAIMSISYIMTMVCIYYATIMYGISDLKNYFSTLILGHYIPVTLDCYFIFLIIPLLRKYRNTIYQFKQIVCSSKKNKSRDNALIISQYKSMNIGIRGQLQTTADLHEIVEFRLNSLAKMTTIFCNVRVFITMVKYFGIVLILLIQNNVTVKWRETFLLFIYFCFPI